VPFDCRYRQAHGPEVCLTACAATDLARVFDYTRVSSPDDVPAAERAVVDVALLDMHHGWPNLGHDALVHAVQNQVCDLREELAARGMRVRLLSYDVRRGRAIPGGPGRHLVYIGTGGPGHLDPRRNDGLDPGSQGIREDPGWEAPLFRLFDDIAADPRAALFGVCHTFGVMCRWLGIADAVLRPREKGGKSTGIVDNVLTATAIAHPWFARFARRLPDGRQFKVLDSRLYDLVPRAQRRDVLELSYEAGPGARGDHGDALTMIQVAADGEGAPRVLAVNHHPEIVNRERQMILLRRKRDRGDVSDDWYQERLHTLEQSVAGSMTDHLLHLTSSYTLLAPLRTHVCRVIAQRAGDIGAPLDLTQCGLQVVYDATTGEFRKPL
jgi:hypothetical protein